MSFLTVQTCHLAVFRSRGGARLQCRRHGELGPGDLPRDGVALRPPRVVQLQQVHGHADRGPRDCPHGQSAPRHVTSRHVTACWAGLLGGLFVCCLLGWWAGLVDGWLLVRGAEDDGDDCSGNSMVACLLAACLVAGLVWWMGG